MAKMYKKRDVVRMKSGSPKMTVGESHLVQPHKLTNVTWYEAGEIRTAEVETVALEFIPKKRRKGS